MGLLGKVTGRWFRVEISKKRVKQILHPHKIYPYLFTLGDRWPRIDFMVERGDACRALEILEDSGITVYSTAEN